VILDETGRADFAKLHADVAAGYAPKAVLYAFDLLYLCGHDLRALPLRARRDILISAVGIPNGAILLSEEYVGDGAAFFEKARAMDLEGIVSKRIDRPYRSGRRDEWVKIKCVKLGTFTVVGYQPPASARGAVGSLHVAVEEHGRLRYAGAVGTGFSDAVAFELKTALDTVKIDRAALATPRIKGAVWVRPGLRVEIAYRGWTAGGELRHASFKGLRQN
jgi:bifunctional non-homologous end joining protein LigD